MVMVLPLITQTQGDERIVYVGVFGFLSVRVTLTLFAFIGMTEGWRKNRAKTKSGNEGGEFGYSCRPLLGERGRTRKVRVGFFYR